jgi:hypothetical protein
LNFLLDIMIILGPALRLQLFFCCAEISILLYAFRSALSFCYHICG